MYKGVEGAIELAKIRLDDLREARDRVPHLVADIQGILKDAGVGYEVFDPNGDPSAGEKVFNSAVERGTNIWNARFLHQHIKDGFREQAIKPGKTEYIILSEATVNQYAAQIEKYLSAAGVEHEYLDYHRKLSNQEAKQELQSDIANRLASIQSGTPISSAGRPAGFRERLRQEQAGEQGRIGGIGG